MCKFLPDGVFARLAECGLEAKMGVTDRNLGSSNVGV